MQHKRCQTSVSHRYGSATGCAVKKKGTSDKARFMNIEQGSIEECRYYLILSKDLDYGANDELMHELVEASKLLERYVTAILASVS